MSLPVWVLLQVHQSIFVQEPMWHLQQHRLMEVRLPFINGKERSECRQIKQCDLFWCRTWTGIQSPMTSNANCVTGSPATSIRPQWQWQPVAASGYSRQSRWYYLFRNQCHIHSHTNQWRQHTCLSMEKEWRECRNKQCDLFGCNTCEWKYHHLYDDQQCYLCYRKPATLQYNHDDRNNPAAASVSIAASPSSTYLFGYQWHLLLLLLMAVLPSYQWKKMESECWIKPDNLYWWSFSQRRCNSMCVDK